MVRESGYSLRARKDVDDGNVKVNTSNNKDAGNPSTVKANESDLAKNTKAKRVEKEAAPSPGTRKSLRLEGHKAPSPLSTPDKCKKALPSNSPGQRKHAEERNVSEDKITEEEDTIKYTVESEKSESQSVSGKKRKGMSVGAFRKMFKVQCVRTVEFVSDDEEIEGADDFSTDAVVTDKIVLKPPAVNGLKDSQSGLSLKESLPDHERGGTNSASTVNLDSVNLERSFLLTRSQDGTVQSEIRDACMDPKDDDEIEGADGFSTDAVVTDKIVLEPPAVNGLKVPQSGPSLKESLPDNERGEPSSPSMMNLDSVNLERSFPLTRSQDGTVPSEIRDTCLDPKHTDGLMGGYEKLSVYPTAMDNVVDQPPDSGGLKDSCISLHGNILPTNSSNGLMDESEKLSVDPTIMDNVVAQPLDGNVLKDSCTSLCENVIPTNSSCVKSVDSLEKEISDCFVMSKSGAMSENGDNCIHPEAPEVRPSPETNSGGLSEICAVCSKRKRVRPGSQEKDHCSCRATINMDVVQNLSMTPSCKDGGDQEAAAATLETTCLNNVSLLKEPHSDHLINGRGNVWANGSNNGENLKRKSRPIADTRTSKFLEYWLPVLTSNHQLEQYCAILLSSSLHLCSVTKTDRIGALHDTLENVRKVCDHSYLRDLSLQERLIYKERRPAEDVLDIGIKASGKFELLDMMLTEIKNRGSQVLILFQSIRGESATNGDILAEFLHKRFGEDSYEHVEGISPKKQDAVNRFNKREKGVFVFLLETRACSSAIKLLSLDNVIIYNSDWNPLNDLKALHKMSIGSKPEQIKVFRLYTSFTCEERSLILAKQNANSTECSLQTSSRAIIDNLLMWGASHLFSKLNDYHTESTSSLYVSTQQSLLTEVIGEFKSILSSCENGDLTTVIAKAYKLEGGWYSSNIPLLGQKQIIVEECQEPHVFWKKLLDRKTPNWKLSGEPCSRNRKRVPYLDGLPSKPDTVNGDVGNKRRKAANENADAVLVQVEVNWTEVPNRKKGPSIVTTRNESHSLQNNAVTETSNLNANQTCNGAEVNTLEPAEATALSNEQKGLHSSLLGQLTELCNILKFSDDVTDSARRFLEYIIKHHQVNSDSPATLHAFIISLCWMAASISKQKVDKKNSLLLAKQHLNYQCTEERAKSVYLKMRSLKKIQLPEQDVNREPLSADDGVANLASCKLLQVRKELVEKPANEEHETDSQVSKIERKCLKRQKRLTLKHQEELQALKRTWEEKKRILVKDQELETAMVRSLFVEGCSTRKEKLKRLEDALQMKMKEHNLLMELELKNLVAVQNAAMKEEKQKAECWIGVTKVRSSEQITVTMPPVDDATRVVTDSFQVLEDQNPNGSVLAQGNDVENPVSKDQSVELTTEVRVEEVPQIAQNEKVSPDKNNSSSAEQLNQTESDSQSPSNFAEVASQEPVDAATTVQLSNGVLEEGELQEVELLVEEAAPTTENQSTVNSETVPIVDPMPITEQPDGNLLGVVENQSQHTSTDIQVEVSGFVDRSNNAMSDIELQNQDVPALENERNSDLGAAERIAEQLHAELPTVENQSTFYEVPMSETAENLIHLQSNVEGPSNTDQGRNSSRIAEVAETQLHRDESVPQNEDLNMRSVAHHHHHPRPRLSLNPAAHQLPSPNPPPFVDPIQYELEKMTKEKDQLQKSHVDLVARLKSDREKEIEEMINQIKQKYQMKLQEAESEHTIRKTQAEMNINKMLANMKLAEAFRYKCLDVRLPGPSGNHPGASSSGVYMQQMRQLAMLPSPRYPAGASSTFQPSTSPTGASSTFQPSTSQQNRNSIIQPVRPNPMRLSTGTSHSATATTTAAQSVQHTPPLFATPHPRPPPYVSSINHNPHTPTGELRSPAMHHLSVSPVPLLQSVSTAPHIQSVSPTPHLQSVSLAPHLQSVSPAPHLQSVSPAPHIQSSRPSAGPPVLPTTSVSRPQYQPLILPHAQQSIPQSSQNGNGPQGRLSIQPNQSPSAVALLMEMDRGSRVPANTASVSRGGSPTCAVLESSELGVVGKVHSNRSPLPVGHDVVCLSDDD